MFVPGGWLHARRHASECRSAVPSEPSHPDLCAHALGMHQISEDAFKHSDPPLATVFTHFCVISRPVPGYGAALSANPLVCTVASSSRWASGSFEW